MRGATLGADGGKDSLSSKLRGKGTRGSRKLRETMAESLCFVDEGRNKFS